MKVYYDIVQGTEDWHKIRYGKIGGTSAKGLFTKGDNLLDEILAAKSEDFELDESVYISNDMQRGTELEPIALQNTSEYTGIKFINVGWLQCEENELLGISPDGISECFKYMVEIKCPGSKRHLQTIKSNEIPLDNIHQCIHAFTVNPFLEKIFFCSFRPENKFKGLFIKELTKESIVNIGTEAKPVLESIKNCVLMSKSYADKLLIDVEEKIKILNF